jgi:hypothetical protein
MKVGTWEEKEEESEWEFRVRSVSVDHLMFS